jgi:hypothetical protein
MQAECTSKLFAFEEVERRAVVAGEVPILLEKGWGDPSPDSANQGRLNLGTKPQTKERPDGEDTCIRTDTRAAEGADGGAGGGDGRATGVGAIGGATDPRGGASVHKAATTIRMKQEIPCTSDFMRPASYPAIFWTIALRVATKATSSLMC